MNLFNLRATLKYPVSGTDPAKIALVAVFRSYVNYSKLLGFYNNLPIREMTVMMCHEQAVFVISICQLDRLLT